MSTALTGEPTTGHASATEPKRPTAPLGLYLSLPCVAVHVFNNFLSAFLRV